MLAISLGQAKTAAMLVVVVLVALALVAAWVMKTVTQKLAFVVIIGLLATLVWTQRSSLDECAARVRESRLTTDTTCSFFGRDVEISQRRQ